MALNRGAEYWVALVAPECQRLGLELVRIRQRGTVLQIMAEPHDGSTMTLALCTALSKALSPRLDVEDPIKEAYTLEVSSPGLDRPLTSAQDFVRFAGFNATIEMHHELEGQRKFSGTLEGLDSHCVRLSPDIELPVIKLPVEDVRSAHLIADDFLLTEAQAGRFPPQPVPQLSEEPSL